MTQPQTHILTFGTPEFGRALSIQSRTIEYFSTAHHVICGPDHPAVQLAMAENPELFAKKRGFGYWIWKYYLILDALERLPEGDHVLYLDAGIAAVADMGDWLADIQQYDAAFFRPDPPHLAGQWTKRDCFIQLRCDEQDYYEAPILSAGIQSYRVGDVARSFLTEIRDIMRNGHLLDDSPNQLGQDNLSGFVEHRHDQSVLSLLVQRYQHPVLIEPTQYGQSQNRKMNQVLDVHRLGQRSALSFFFWRRKRRRRMSKQGYKTI